MRLSFILITFNFFASCSTTKTLLINSEAMQVAVHNLCDKEIALLGEASHGDGETFRFKVELIKRLISECGFKGIFTESGIYAYVPMSKKEDSNQIVDADEIRTSTLWLWGRTKEFSELADYLAAEINRGNKILIGGIDEQFSGLRSTATLAQDLTSETDVSPDCGKRIASYTGGGYYKTKALFTHENENKLIECITKIVRTVPPSKGSQRWTSIEAQSLLKIIHEDFNENRDASPLGEKSQFNHRDLSMFENFQILKSQLPPKAKVIVWAASTHLAKTHNGISDMPAGTIPFGAHVHKTYGQRAYALAFTAASGSYGWIKAKPEIIPAAPSDSLESKVQPSNSEDFKFLTNNELSSLGQLQARSLGYAFKTADWAKVFDGMVWIREEHPPAKL